MAYEPSASGKFNIVVVSNQVGAFKLLVKKDKAEGGDEEDVEALEAKIEQLRQQLSEAEA